jgi:hypothetical protein
VLIPLYEAYRAAYEALISVHNQPRVQGLAADIIESESVRVIDFACGVAVKLSQLASIKDRWREPYIKQWCHTCSSSAATLGTRRMR